MECWTVPATVSELPKVLERIGEELRRGGCPPEVETAVLIAAEELFVNIASYAYDAPGGVAELSCAAGSGKAEVCFRDRGAPYNPLSRAEPDITLDAEERPIGGLGIFMVRQMMDTVSYVYREGRNTLTIIKCWPEKHTAEK